MKPETVATLAAIAAVVTCIVTCGSVLVFFGKALGKLEGIADGVRVALLKTDRHSEEISNLKVDLEHVKTTQENCSNCP